MLQIKLFDAIQCLKASFVLPCYPLLFKVTCLLAQFLFWGCTKIFVFAEKIRDLYHPRELIFAAITTVIPDMFDRTWNENYYLLDIGLCRATNGRAEQIETFYDYYNVFQCALILLLCRCLIVSQLHADFIPLIFYSLKKMIFCL